ncbi:MAG: type II toxin-antitoxin system VapC family toxin [Bryobacter sp.]|nr:type II toxin-antitoxin system VapC family toxin [Bryobacter sp.]
MSAVVDASFAVEFLLHPAEFEEVRKEFPAPWHAPHLIDAEVLHALRGLWLGKHLSPGRAEECLTDFRQLPLRRHAHAALAPRVWELRGHLSAYDALYVALAEAIACPLLTRDARLARSRSHRAQLRLI